MQARISADLRGRCSQVIANAAAEKTELDHTLAQPDAQCIKAKAFLTTALRLYGLDRTTAARVNKQAKRNTETRHLKRTFPPLNLSTVRP
eukprot:6205480-Pleurochrysis_carterae.AAC.4